MYVIHFKDKPVEKPVSVIIREVSTKKKTFQVNPEFSQRYGGGGCYPTEFPYTSRWDENTLAGRRKRKQPTFPSETVV